MVHGLLSSCGAQAPERVGSVVVVCGLSCPGAWDLSSPTRDLTHVLCIRRQFLTTGPPGKSLKYILQKFL